MRKRYIIYSLPLFVVGSTVYGGPDDIHDVDLLKRVKDLQAQVMEIKEQYASITSNLERILHMPGGVDKPAIFFKNRNKL